MSRVAMRRIGVLSLVLASACLTGCPPSLHGADEQALVWPDGAPLALGSRRHDEPRLFYYFPDPAVATETAVIIASGGSYGHHGGLRREGEPTARWLASQGITAVVVRYRVGERGRYDHRAFMADGARAVQIVRARARELGLAPDRIGFLGYSAGGHLAASVATRCPSPGAPSTATPIELPSDAVSEVSCRPDFAAAVYPVITFEPAHVYERGQRNLLGDVRDPPPALVDALSVERQVTATTAPMFVVHSRLDEKVDPANSELLHAALVAHGVPARLLMAEDGGHGLGLAQDAERWPQMSRWPAEFLAWVQQLGKLEPRGAR